MSLVFYNTLSKKKEVFKPIEEKKVKIYLCGPTVYDYLHIGNFRGAITYNLLRNWLEKSGYDVTMVYNYTDVDDKIINRAKEEGVESTVISERYIAEFEKDFNRLGLRPHSYNPRVTEFMPQIIEYVETLVKRKAAYVVDGEVFYSIDNFSDYGKLSGKKLEDLEAGQRVEVDKRKKNPFDFVLWKPSKEGEPSWDSPWGKGRPGWHIECSAMIRSLLGDTIDIHGGGIDLIFPHHENEIAQGEGATGCKYCNFWIHNEFINFKDQKMSKSLGNVMTARAFMDKYHPEIMKYFMLSSHYRSQLAMSEEKMNNVISSLARVYSSLREAQPIASDNGKVGKQLETAILQANAKIKKSLNDDLNTGEVFAAIFEVVRVYNSLNLSKKMKDPNSAATAKEFMNWVKEQGAMMALFQENPKTFLKDLDDILLKEKGLERAEIDQLVKARQEARSNKDFSRSDELRDKLIELGIDVHDGVEGVSWEVRK